MKQSILVTSALLLASIVTFGQQRRTAPIIPNTGNPVPVSKELKEKMAYLEKRAASIRDERERQGLPPMTFEQAIEVTHQLEVEYAETKIKQTPQKNQSRGLTDDDFFNRISIESDALPVQRIEEPLNTNQGGTKEATLPLKPMITNPRNVKGDRRSGSAY